MMSAVFESLADWDCALTLVERNTQLQEAREKQSPKSGVISMTHYVATDSSRQPQVQIGQISL
jgi:hypothetical protein